MYGHSRHADMLIHHHHLPLTQWTLLGETFVVDGAVGVTAVRALVFRGFYLVID